jgi:hypothetical protein
MLHNGTFHDSMFQNGKATKTVHYYKVQLQNGTRDKTVHCYKTVRYKTVHYHNGTV